MTKSTPRSIAVTEGGRQTATIKRHRENGPLHDLLLKACPPSKKGEKSITILAKALHVSASAVHRWIKRKKIPPKRAADVVTIADGRVTLANFSPFIYF